MSLICSLLLIISCLVVQPDLDLSLICSLQSTIQPRLDLSRIISWGVSFHICSWWHKWNRSYKYQLCLFQDFQLPYLQYGDYHAIECQSPCYKRLRSGRIVAWTRVSGRSFDQRGCTLFLHHMFEFWGFIHHRCFQPGQLLAVRVWDLFHCGWCVTRPMMFLLEFRSARCWWRCTSTRNVG